MPSRSSSSPLKDLCLQELGLDVTLAGEDAVKTLGELRELPFSRGYIKSGCLT